MTDDVTYEMKFVLFTIGMVLFAAVSVGFFDGHLVAVGDHRDSCPPSAPLEGNELLGMAVGGL